MMKNLEKTLGEDEQQRTTFQITQGQGEDQLDDEESEDEEAIAKKKGK